MSPIYKIVELYTDNVVVITWVLCGVIVVVGMMLLLSKGERSRLVPGLAVSAGIFCTFLGLAISFLAASTEGVQGKFDALLAGLSTAFWTSVVGMGFSMVAKFILAGRKHTTPLQEARSEIANVRNEIKGLGKDISGHLTSAISESIDQYAKVVSASLIESGQRVADLNASYERSISSLSSGIDQLLTKVENLVEPTTSVVAATQSLCEETGKLLQGTGEILASQKKWFGDVENSMNSIVSLSPEARKVFESIDKLNESHDMYQEKVGRALDQSQIRIENDVAKITENAIKRIVDIEHGQHERIVEQLGKIDKAVSRSFDVVSENYGKGLIALVEKKLEVIAEIVTQLERAKEFYVHPNEGSENSTHVPQLSNSRQSEGVK